MSVFVHLFVCRAENLLSVCVVHLDMNLACVYSKCLKSGLFICCRSSVLRVTEVEWEIKKLRVTEVYMRSLCQGILVMSNTDQKHNKHSTIIITEQTDNLFLNSFVPEVSIWCKSTVIVKS